MAQFSTKVPAAGRRYITQAQIREAIASFETPRGGAATLTAVPVRTLTVTAPARSLVSSVAAPAFPVVRPALAPVADPAPVLAPNVVAAPVFAPSVRYRVARAFVLGAGAICVTQLLLSVATATGVYQLADLKKQKAELDVQVTIAEQEIAALSSNSNLQNQAARLGLVESGTPVFLDIETGKVTGKAVPADGSRIRASLVENVVLDEVTGR